MPRGKRKTINLTEAISYFEEVKDLKKTSKYFSVSTPTLNKIFKENGYDTSPVLSSLNKVLFYTEHFDLIREYAETHRKIEVAEHFNLSLESLSRVFKNVGYFMPISNSVQYCHETKKLNGSYLKSADEELFYKTLVEKFGEDDVVRQYGDNRYQFKCDFYIKSLDVFLEINCFQTHYFYPFTGTQDDLLLLDQFKSKSDWVSRGRVRIWADNDVLKRQVAIKNKLNYFMVYPTKTFRNLDRRVYNLYGKDMLIAVDVSPKEVLNELM